jgi:glycogen synthase
MMHILMLSYEFPPLGGGGAKVVFGLSKELVRLGHDVDVVTMGFRGLPKHEKVNLIAFTDDDCVPHRRVRSGGIGVCRGTGGRPEQRFSCGNRLSQGPSGTAIKNPVLRGNED